MTRQGLTATAAALGLALAAAAPAVAAKEQMPVQLAQAAAFSDAELRSFASAAVEVGAIRSEAEAEMQSAADATELQRINDAAIERMVETVERAPGISLEQYNAIARASAEDPALAERVALYMQEAAD